MYSQWFVVLSNLRFPDYRNLQGPHTPGQHWRHGYRLVRAPVIIHGAAPRLISPSTQPSLSKL